MFKILFDPKEAKRHPLTMMFVAIFYSSISILISSQIFPEHSSLVMVFLTLLSCLYVVQGAIKIEEQKEVDYKSEKWLLEQHVRILVFFLFLFLGFVISFSFWTLVLDQEKVDVLFEVQSSVVEGIKTISATGKVVSSETFFIILNNNFKVLLISLILAFFYGAGAIFVIVWNASIMGFVIGNITKNSLGLTSLPLISFKYFLHGIFEMLAYLTIALAGGIIYVSISKGDLFEEGKTKRIITDVSILFLASILLLVLAAFIEVYISSHV